MKLPQDCSSDTRFYGNYSLRAIGDAGLWDPQSWQKRSLGSGHPSQNGMTTAQHGAGRFSPSLSYAMKSTTNV